MGHRILEFWTEMSSSPPPHLCQETIPFDHFPVEIRDYIEKAGLTEKEKETDFLEFLRAFPSYQYTFQNKHVKGKCLNVGANNDSTRLRDRGVINVDVVPVDKATGIKNEVHLLADGRLLPFSSSSFDSLILGDILEHMEEETVRDFIDEARRVLVKGGVLAITCPEDHRPRQNCGNQYIEGVNWDHSQIVTLKKLLNWFHSHHFKVVDIDPYLTPNYWGWGVAGVKEP